MEKVAVIGLLSSMPSIGTLDVPFLSMVIADTLKYFNGVWSNFMIRECSIWCASAWLTV